MQKWYWYSSSQKEARLSVISASRVESRKEVLVGDNWREFTEVTSVNKPSGKWSDYSLVASGEDKDLKCRCLK